MRLKPRDEKFLDLFPQFMAKAGSKLHSKFLFGDSVEQHLFRDLKNVHVSKDIYTKNIMPFSTAKAPPPHSLVVSYKNEQKERVNQIFENLNISDVNERQFFQNNVLDQADYSDTRAMIEARGKMGMGGQLNADIKSHIDKSNFDCNETFKSNQTLLSKDIEMFEHIPQMKIQEGVELDEQVMKKAEQLKKKIKSQKELGLNNRNTPLSQ